ncbi:VCBS repeat-containing protein, partial [Pseudomonas fluvialis]
MSSVVAIIKSVIGQVFAVSIEGIQRQIFEGDRLLQGEQLLTGNLGAVTLQTTDGKAIELGNNQQWPLREEEAKQQDVDEDASVEELQQAITAGVDPSAEMDDTAAGPAAAGGSGGGSFGGGHSFVMLDATNQQLQAEVGYTTGTPGELATAQGVEQERNDNPRTPQELDPVAPTLVISSEAQSLLIGQSTQIRFSFSESVQGFSAADIASSGGTISDLVQIDATTWVATFTRGTSGAPGISVPAGSYTDLVGNPGIAGSLAINGAPQASDSTASTGENAVLNGNVPAASDVDGTISRYTLITGPGAGNLTFNADGSYSFDPGSAFDDLPVGASREVTFSYTVTDNSGAVSVPASVTITVTGTNDAPVAQAASVSVAEDAALLSGSVVATDVDANATLSFALNGTAPAGLTFNSDGSYSFNAADSAYQSLGVGQSAVLTIPYTVTDDQGATSSANLVITVTGTNDAPVAQAASVSVAEDAALLSGSVVATDVDANATLSYALNNAAPAGLTFNSDGSYSFNAADSAYQSLGVGQSATLTIPYTVTDDQGGTSTANLVITVTGTNDAPVAQAASVSVAEDAALLSGSVVATDVDANATLNYALNNAAPAGLTFNSDGSYSFNAADSAYQSLGVGQSATLTIPYTVTDDQGATSTANLVITVTGTNDAPVAQAASVSVAEDAALLSGSVVATDVDANATLSYALNNAAPAGLTFNSDGSYSFNAANSAYQSLGVGQSATLTIPYTVTDDQGATSTANLVITVTGTNDAPVAQAASVSVAEDAALLSGSVVATDVDANATLSYALNNAAPAGLTFNSDGSYSFNAADSAYQSLGVGQSAVLTIPYTVTDDQGATSTANLVITVTGTNDAPVAQAASVSVAEDAALLSGSVVATDVDANATLSYALNNAAPAGLTFNSDGSYSFNAADSAYQSLGVGQSAVLTIPYTVTDDQGATSTANLVITVTGTNDLSVISSASVNLIESNASLNTGGTLSISDVDGPAPSFNPISNAAGSGGYGLFKLGSDGLWSYTTTGPLNQLVAGQTYTDTLTVTATDGSTGTITVSILGTNDAPALGGVRTSFTYSESAASGITRTLLDSSVTLTDIDSSNFDGGSVVVTIGNGIASQDELTVLNQGTASGQISVAGSDVFYNFGSGAISIGTISGGTAGIPLTISLNGNATPVAVDALVQRIAYGNSSQLPDTTPRTISITVNDGDGTANGGSSSVTQNITMSVASVNDAPTFSNLSGTRTFTEGGSAVVLDSNASLGDRELATLADFGGASLTLSRRGGANGDDDFTGTGSLTLSAGEVRLGGVLVGSYDQTAMANGTLQITFNSGTSNAQANSVLSQIAYSNGSDAPPASVIVDYVLNDNNSGAQGSGGAKTATGSVTINITPVNDAPVAGNQSNNILEDAPFNGQVIASDVDGGTLSYSLVSGTSNGSVTLDTSTGAFVYTPNPGYNGADSFTVQVSDGRGGVVNSVININVTPFNDAPVLSLTTPATPVEGNAAVGDLISTASATDEDTPASGLSFSLTNNPGGVYA